MPTIYIDGQAHEVSEGDNLLQAALGLGLDLPYFCWHPAMGSIGACRQCAVLQYQDEDDTRGRIVMGCMTPVTEGARFSLAADRAQAFREDIIESLMLNHPHDCPVCAEGGECHLQDMTVMVGHRDREYQGRKNTHRNQHLGPLIHHEMNRCITCYRCTRYYRDYAGGTDLAAMASHDHVYFGRHEEGVLESEFAGNLVEVCPTGVFTDKSLVHDYTRKWDLQSAPSVCTACSVGCNIMPGERYGKLKRIHNRFNHDVNGYFLCDRGRFGGHFVNSEDRIPAVGKRDGDGRFSAVDADSAVSSIAALLRQGKTIGIGSPRSSVEANYLLRELVGAENYCTGMSAQEGALVQHALQQLEQSQALVPSIRAMESADAVLVLGEDVTNTAPRIALALRQSVRNKAYAMAADLRLEAWQDAAIRNLAQDQRSPLSVLSVAATRLDDVASHTAQLCPDDIARVGFAIAAELEGALPAVDLGAELAELAKTIADTLRSADIPLVVSGTGCGHSGILDASAAIARALTGPDRPAQLSFCLAECNSLGAALVADGAGMGLEEVLELAAQDGIDNLLILENDLFRRTSCSKADSLFQAAGNVVLLDTLTTPTCDNADWVLPTSSFAETEGTLISQEGRAQRHFPVFNSVAPIRENWRWLLDIGHCAEVATCKSMVHFDDVTTSCANTIKTLFGICAAAPAASSVPAADKVPRQTHRFSGRTAMRANISVHEPRQPTDEESPLSFTMEGHSAEHNGALLPYVWSPGWNSNQSLHKYQSAVGGALQGGTAGTRLIEPGDIDAAQESSGSTAPALNAGEYRLVPLYRIFGSEEMSVRAPAVAQLCRPAGLEMPASVAAELGVSNGDGVTLTATTGNVDLEVTINDSLAANCVGYSHGVSGTGGLVPGSATKLCRAENWQRAPELIGTDRGATTA